MPGAIVPQSGSTFGYDADQLELEKIARRRKVAEALQAQSTSPLGDTQVVNGYAVARSPLEGIAKVVQGYSARKQQDALDAEGKTIAERRMGDIVAGLDQYEKIKNGSAGGMTAPTTPNDDEGNANPSVNMPAVAGDPRAAIAGLMSSKSPTLQQYGFGLRTKQDTPTILPKDASLLDPTTHKLLYTAPTNPKYHVVAGALVPEPQPNATAPVQPAYTAPKDQWGEPYQLGGQTVQKNATTGQIRQAVTQPHQVNTNVAVSTDKSYAGHVASGLATQDVAAIDAGRSAPQRIQSAQAVKDFLNKNPITGTFAEGRLSFEKGLATAGLIDGERVKNTEGLASTLASQTLDAIKTSGLGSGQGFTDKDRAFLERAKSGNIEINHQTLRYLADLNEKSGRASIERANGVIKKLKGSKEMGNVGVGLDEIQVPGAAGGSQFKVLGVEQPGG